MSTSMLKIIACVLMLIDHMGAALFPEVIILRMIGRVSFPIFAYLIAVGYSKTKCFSRYLYRLFLFAAISQIPFSLAFRDNFSINSFSDFLRFVVGSPTPHLNIFFTLAIGLIALRVWDTGESKLGKKFAILGLGLTAQAFSTDYGIYGVAMILAFYLFKDNNIKTITSQIIIFLVFYASQILLMTLDYPGSSFKLIWFNQALSLLALIFIFRYNGEKGKGLKYLFYLFYPLHLLIIGLIRIFI